MRLLLTGFAVATCMYALVVLMAYSFQRSLLYFPDTGRPDTHVLSKYGLVAVTITTPNSGELSSLWSQPRDGTKAVILHLHGNGGGTATRVAAYQALASDGAGVLAVGYPGYGGNSGMPGEEALYEAAQANYDWLLERGFKPHQIVIVGQSLGTGVATWIAKNNDAAGLILEAAFTGMDDMAQRQFSFLPAKALIKDRYRSLDRINQIAMPLSWIHGTHDQLIPFSMGQRLFDAADQPKRAHPIENGGHNDLWQRGIDRIIREEVSRFVAIKRRDAER